MKNAEKQELDRLYRHFVKASKEMAGYPLSLFFNYSKLTRFLKFHINNLGDPFLKSWHYRMNTLEIEKKVITRLAQLFHAPKDNFWGYVTNGGTEGNLYGLYVAREMYPNGVVYYSDHTHYCLPKIVKLLRMSAVKVPCDEKGEMDYVALQNVLDGNVPIIVANIGTTMTGAVDDVVRIKQVLSDLKIEKFYIHCDAAFFGMILPFLPEFETQPFDFRLGIDSIAISGHKMIGTPIPCGAVLCKKSNMEQIGSFIEYTGARDSTINGSRNGLSPLFLWHELHCAKEGKFETLIRHCIDLAGYAIQQFNAKGVKAWRNKHSTIVVFPKPSDPLIRKWQLAIEGDIAHIITLPHLTHKTIDAIVNEIASDLKKRRRKR